ncbi:hypothetical protein N7533_005105 [Penicillium manginii]|uniref:uncharacterized protein n=1 Tax=Penicillium manginii TaxID=203109 RepID=UPI002546871B|nr:uncharacterized protein N7533_005105 [Penicillium manginii]KAJ5755562.1 hypothetical protein N7533_005105 [Penicillium manginii]
MDRSPWTALYFRRASLAALRQRVYREGNGILAANHAGLIRCCDCSGNLQQSERKCRICGAFKTLDSFAKNQRQHTEPTCVPCQDFMMNNDDEFDKRENQRLLQRSEEDSPTDRAIEGPPPAPRRRLALLVAEEGTNDCGLPAEPSPLSRDRLIDHDALNAAHGFRQPSTSGRAYESAVNRATEPRPPRTEINDETESRASSDLTTNNEFLLEYGSDDDTIVPRPERARTGWAKIRVSIDVS